VTPAVAESPRRPAPNPLVTRNLALVTAIASRLKRTTLTGADLDDLIGYGTIGLVEAARRFDPARGLAFSTYAYPRIAGAMLDGARLSMGGKRGGHLDVASVEPECLDAAVDPAERPDAIAERCEVARAVRAAIATLLERERSIVESVDLAGRTLEDAGRDWGISKPRACVIRNEALAVLRARLGSVGF